MRRLLRDIAEGREFGDVTTLREPAVTAQLEDRIRARRAQDDRHGRFAGIFMSR
jgi:acetyl-CoA synthetase